MKSERGATMVEMIGVIGILGVLAASSWSLIGSGWKRYRVSQAVSQLQDLQKGINRFYAATGNYNELLTNDAEKKVIENNIAPKEMIVAGRTLRHAFGGNVEVRALQYTDTGALGTDSESFTITFKDLDKPQCLEMATISWLQKDTVDLLKITIESDIYTWPVVSPAEGDKVLPINIVKAEASCNQDKSDIIWEFR